MRSRARGTTENSWNKKATMMISLRGDIRDNQGIKMVTMKIGLTRETKVNQGTKIAPIKIGLTRPNKVNQRTKTVIIITISTQEESKMKEGPSNKMIKE